MAKRVMKYFIPFVIGVIVIAFFLSYRRGEAVNWNYVIQVCIAGLIGIFLGTGFRRNTR